MKQILANKLSLISGIFSFVLLFQLTIGMYQNKLDEKDLVIENEREKTEIAVSLREDQQKNYEDTMSRIVQHLASTDSYVNIGGGGDSPEYFDSNIFQEILETSASNNFTLFLSNVELYFDERKEYKDTLPNIWPLEYNPRLKITSPDGDRYSPFTGDIRTHEGTDMASALNSKVLATAPGFIEEHWIDHNIYGKLIIINHENGYRTKYAHNSVTYVHERNDDGTPMRVERGDIIARTGVTGLADGDHLHYQIEKWNEEKQIWENVDVIPFMQDIMEEGNKIL